MTATLARTARRDAVLPALLLLAAAFAALPLDPTLIFVSSVTPPGLSLVPRAIAGSLLVATLAGAAALYGLVLIRGVVVPATFGPLAAYVAAWAVAAALGLDPATGALFVLAGLCGLSVHLGVVRFYQARQAATVLFAAFLGSGTLVSLLGLGMVALKRPAGLYATVHGRAVSTFIVPGEFAGYLLILIPAGAGVALTSRRVWLRVLGASAALLGTLALWDTYSRAGWYGLSVGVAFFIYVQRRRWWVAVLLVIALIVEAIWLAGFNDHHNPSEEFARLPIWLAGLRVIALFPATGVGPGAFRHVYSLAHPPSAVTTAFHAHGYLLNSFAETGVVGMATLGFAWWSFASTLKARLAVAEPSARRLGLALAAGFVATWVQGSVDFVQIVVLGCWLPFMAVALEAARYGLNDS